MNVGTISADVFEAFHANNPAPSAESLAAPVVSQVKGAEPSSGGTEPTYAEAFPPLMSEGGSDPTGRGSPPKILGPGVQWNKMALKSSTTTQVFSVPLEERRYKEMSEQQQFGDRGREQAKICSDIMSSTGVTIEMSLAKDQSLTVIVTGRLEAVRKAKKMMIEKLQTQTRTTLHIPKEHHRYILGTKGRKLAELELQTATKISVPRPNENSDAIVITGTREGIDKACQELQLISDEQSKLAVERLQIPKVYHPFISGPDGQTVRDLIDETGARISVPSHATNREEIVISGEKEGVARAKQVILDIYEEKKRKTQTVSVEVKKSQHRYLIGNRGNGLSEILAETGVSVEVPPIDTPSETITLRGDPDKLGPALTLVYSKANSVVMQEVEAPAWLHRFIIGRQGSNVRRITQEYPRVHVEITDEMDQIRVEGPPDDVEKARAEIETIVKDLVAKMAFVELEIDQKYHRHIIGRQGANVTRLKNDYDVEVKVPADSENSRVVRVEGVSEGVAKAKKEILELVDKMENEKSRDILVDHKLHRLIIGQQGSKIREIRDLFPEVQIHVPEASLQSDVIRLRGPKADVDKCYQHLQKIAGDLVLNNQTAEVRLYKQFYRDVVGRNGANIHKIREETDTKIDIANEAEDYHTAIITGTKENCEKARKKLEATQDAIAKIKEVTVNIPHDQHTHLLAFKGQLIKSIQDDCGSVIIRFPSATSKSDKVLIRGLAEDVDKAEKQLLQLASEQKEQHCTLEMRAKPEHHRFLIGRNGANVREIQKRTGVRIVFPASKPAAGEGDNDLLTLIGRQEAIEAVKAELQTKLQELDSVVEVEMLVDSKHHRHFTARKGEVIQQISEEFGGMVVSFPRPGVKSDKVVLKGAKNCVDAAQARILEIVKDLESQVTIECVIPQKFHGLVLGPRGQNVHDISRDHSVNIRLPERSSANRGSPSPSPANQEQAAIPSTPENRNGDSEKNGGMSTSISDDSLAENLQGDGKEAEGLNGGEKADGGKGEMGTLNSPRKQDVILITGLPEHCEAAKQALLAMLPITEEMIIAYEHHRYIIGQKGRDVRKIMQDHDVNISIPPAEKNSDVVKITGTRANVDRAIAALELRVQQLDDERELRTLRSFKVEVTVDPKHHPKIIGRKGAVVNKIRSTHDVMIQFPDKQTDASDLIVITGLEKNALEAKEEILKIVRELEDQYVEEVSLDHRIHSRLIGARGRGIRKIMDEFGVDIKFPGKDSTDPDLVTISGPSEDAVSECKDHLLNLEDEYLQDVTEQEEMSVYRYQGGGAAGSGHHDDGGRGSLGGEGYVVRDAPWSTASKDDFPDLGALTLSTGADQDLSGGPPPTNGNTTAPAPGPSHSVKWGPAGRR